MDKLEEKCTINASFDDVLTKTSFEDNKRHSVI
jgi:hypothetical protein